MLSNKVKMSKEINKSELFSCGVCSAKNELHDILVIEKVPSSAQAFNKSQKFSLDNSCTFKAITCKNCQTTQSILKPINDYSYVFRSSDISKELQRFRLKQIKSFISDYQLNGKKVIEIGCGNGENLSLFQDLDAFFFGIEDKKIAINNTAFIPKIEKAFLEHSTKLKEAPFDAFFSFNVLEHWPKFRSVLKNLRDNLKDNSVGIFEVPNYEMILKYHLYNEFIPDHIYYFTPYSFETALRVNGFKVLDLKIIQENYIISATVKKENSLSYDGFYNRFKHLKFQLSDLLNSSDIKKIAIWGAGHQSLTTISTAGLNGKIEFIVDSSPAKQNNYTPASGLQVLPPDALLKNKIDTILVICGSYDLEVIQLIKSKYKLVRNIFHISNGELKRYE